MKTFEDYLEEKFIEENPEHYVKDFQDTDYYENWVMDLSRAKLIELAEKAIKEVKKKEQERIIDNIEKENFIDFTGIQLGEYSISEIEEMFTNSIKNKK